MGVEGDAKRSSVSSASLLERERELRSAVVTPTGAIVFVYERKSMFTRPNRRPVGLTCSGLKESESGVGKTCC